MIVALVFWACGSTGDTMSSSALSAGLCDGWVDYPANPLIEPPAPEWLIADPAVLLPEQSSDHRWHLFANSFFLSLPGALDDAPLFSR